MVKIGDVVKHLDWRRHAIHSYREQIGLVVAEDPRAQSFVQVVWFPLSTGRCKTFHSKDALEKLDVTETQMEVSNGSK